MRVFGRPCMCVRQVLISPWVDMEEDAVNTQPDGSFTRYQTVRSWRHSQTLSHWIFVVANDIGGLTLLSMDLMHAG